MEKERDGEGGVVNIGVCASDKVKEKLETSGARGRSYIFFLFRRS